MKKTAAAASFADNEVIDKAEEIRKEISIPVSADRRGSSVNRAIVLSQGAFSLNIIPQEKLRLNKNYKSIKTVISGESVYKGRNAFIIAKKEEIQTDSPIYFSAGSVFHSAGNHKFVMQLITAAFEDT